MLKIASFFREFAHVLSSMKKNGERALVFPTPPFHTKILVIPSKEKLI